ncbi:MAG: hypothetical protein KC457_16685 [Myxococcales bacterium]|nr:hypothetical protein [Myxococcales bacterium]
MRIREEIRLGVGALLAIQVLTMIAAVALLARMTPAVDRILEENDKSLQAVEAMLLVLAEPAPSSSAPNRRDDRWQRFDAALSVAQGNITEDSEAEVIETIANRAPAALAGDPEQAAAVRDELWELADINRESMFRANERAKLLGSAGAWALVFLGLLGMVASLALMRRARTKLIRPVYELGAVLQACHAGDGHRRFNPLGASWEFREVAVVINSLVEEHFANVEQHWEAVAKVDRLALLSLLDELPGARFVCGRDGTIVAANAEGLRRLSEADGSALREALRTACVTGADDAVDLRALGEVGYLAAAS